jgi:hypothetical protein
MQSKADLIPFCVLQISKNREVVVEVPVRYRGGGGGGRERERGSERGGGREGPANPKGIQFVAIITYWWQVEKEVVVEKEVIKEV